MNCFTFILQAESTSLSSQCRKPRKSVALCKMRKETAHVRKRRLVIAKLFARAMTQPFGGAEKKPGINPRCPSKARLKKRVWGFASKPFRGPNYLRTSRKLSVVVGECNRRRKRRRTGRRKKKDGEKKRAGKRSEILWVDGNGKKKPGPNLGSGGE